MNFKECRDRLDSLTSVLTEQEKPHIAALKKLREEYDLATSEVVRRFLLEEAGIAVGDEIMVRFRGKKVSGKVMSSSAFFNESTGREIVVSVQTQQFGDLYFVFPERKNIEYDTIRVKDIIR